MRHWRASHLLSAWIAYWFTLGAALLAPAVGVLARMMSAPDDKGTLAASLGNGIARLTVEGSGATYSGSMSLSTLLLWVAGPPLLLWLAWLVTRVRPVGDSRRLDASAYDGVDRVSARGQPDHAEARDPAHERSRHLRT